MRTLLNYRCHARRCFVIYKSQFTAENDSTVVELPRLFFLKIFIVKKA